MKTCTRSALGLYLQMKQLYIIAGCNGAGKTTASYAIFPQVLHCNEFVNADEIARGLSPFHPEGVSIMAGKLMLYRIEELLEKEASFAIETTLASKSYRQLVQKAQNKGYHVSIIFFWLPTPEQAISRVAQRVKEGGHDVPRNVIRRRYFAGIKNLFNIYMPIVDYWMIIDNGHTPCDKVATGGKLAPVQVFDDVNFDNIKKYV